MGLLDGPIPSVEFTPGEIEAANREILDLFVPGAEPWPPMEPLFKPKASQK